MLKDQLAPLAAGSQFIAAHSKDVAALLVKYHLEQVPLIRLLAFTAEFTALDAKAPSWTREAETASARRRYTRLRLMGCTPYGLPPGRYLSPRSMDLFIDRIIIGGTWRTCMNCYDQGHGHPADTSFHSEILGCWLGDGCTECDHIGALFTPCIHSRLEHAEQEQGRTLEDMLADCIPGGSVCDPQQIADRIREWFAEKHPTAFTDAKRFEQMLHAEYRAARTFDLNLDETEFKGRRRADYDREIGNTTSAGALGAGARDSGDHHLPAALAPAEQSLSKVQPFHTP